MKRVQSLQESLQGLNHIALTNPESPLSPLELIPKNDQIKAPETDNTFSPSGTGQLIIPVFMDGKMSHTLRNYIVE
jgi:hypothetical protein